MAQTYPAPDAFASPIWVMLGKGNESIDHRLPRHVFVDTRASGWADVLAEGVRSCDPGESRIIAMEGRSSRAFLNLLAHRRWEFGGDKGPSLSRIVAEVERQGGQVVEIYVIWPSLEGPRVAYPRSERRMVRWAQRAGVLGGGGNRLWARYAARSALFTPLATRLTPGLALVITR